MQCFLASNNSSAHTDRARERERVACVYFAIKCTYYTYIDIDINRLKIVMRVKKCVLMLFIYVGNVFILSHRVARVSCAVKLLVCLMLSISLSLLSNGWSFSAHLNSAEQERDRWRD